MGFLSVSSSFSLSREVQFFQMKFETNLSADLDEGNRLMENGSACVCVLVWKKLLGLWGSPYCGYCSGMNRFLGKMMGFVLNDLLGLEVLCSLLVLGLCSRAFFGC